MSKGKMRPGPGFRPAPGGGHAAGGSGGGGAGGGAMLSQLQKLQEEMARAQEKLGDETVQVSAGGGTISAVMTGKQQLVSIKIAKEAVDPEDVEMLQDLIVAVINEAIEKSQGLAAERMGALTGGLNLPGLM